MRWLLTKFNSFSSKVDPAWLHISTILSIGILGYLDFTTGFEISFSLIYLLPIAFSTWYLNLRSGLAYTTISLIVWFGSNILAGQTLSNEWIWVWNFSIRLVVFMTISSILNELKISLTHERLLAATDFLTGAQNKREFYKIAESEIHVARRHQMPISLAYIDIDNFKMVNDTLGHQAGDHLLQEISQMAIEALRKTDIFSRLGGDEFVALLPHTSHKEAIKVARKLKSAIKPKVKKVKKDVSCSIGLATFNRPPASVQELINAADQLMYAGKLKGKNKIVSREF